MGLNTQSNLGQWEQDQVRQVKELPIQTICGLPGFQEPFAQGEGRWVKLSIQA